jgi:hypothetical protein
VIAARVFSLLAFAWSVTWAAISVVGVAFDLGSWLMGVSLLVATVIACVGVIGVARSVVLTWIAFVGLVACSITIIAAPAALLMLCAATLQSVFGSGLSRTLPRGGHA